jgi:DNA-binding CsgD family transcriptional regulator/tetratricopeptide (TPR) repeat protein
VLLGRESECARLDELLDRARLGRSGALVIRGEAGIGKTALLDYAAGRAAGMKIVRALGVESEAELEFSGLLEVCRPLLGLLDEIPENQADALRSALGFGSAEQHDRFSLGAATLSLLAAAAEANPLLVIVDDVQWLDRSSQDALLFATRRLQADRVLVLYATRDDAERAFEAPGIDSFALDGLTREAAASLIPNVVSDVADRLYEATAGNPLALLELPALLTEEQLAGATPLEGPLPAGAAIERAFARRAEALPTDARRAMLVAAVSTSNAAELVVDALESLGVDASSLETAEDAGLVRLVDGRIEFRHPLVRSAVYHAAPPSERRTAHRALADACGESGPEECAWHLAASALGPDEEVAAALARAAVEARRRSGYAAASAALERAARLTPDPTLGAERLVAAGEAAWRAGRGDVALRLVTEALRETLEPSLRAEALRLHGAIEYLVGEAGVAAASLVEAAALLEGSDAAGAVAASADAAYALVRVGRQDQALEMARRARSLAPSEDVDADFEATLALGFGLWFAGLHEESVPHLREAVELGRQLTTIPSPLRAGRTATAFDWLGRYRDGYAQLADAGSRARSAGAVGMLPGLLAVGSWQALHAGHWNEALADAGEALELAEQLAQPIVAMQALGVLVWLHALRGDDARLASYANETAGRASSHGVPMYEHLVLVSFGLRALGDGRADEAIRRLEAADAHPARGHYLPGVAAPYELVEAYVRASRVDDAEEKLRSLDASRLPSAALLTALDRRCRGLLAEGDAFETYFAEALSAHEEVQSPFALARTRLCYGERLRRAGRRVDAREQLRLAVDVFERLGAVPWAERTRAELRASGETLRRRDAIEAEQLTPQELQIALQVAEGKTNKEVGAALFLSHKTVEFHLSRIYRKLDLNSRAELIRQFAAEGAPAGAGTPTGPAS